MKITFIPNATNSASQLVAYACHTGTLPAGLEAVLSEGAKAARFEGKAGQLY